MATLSSCGAASACCIRRCPGDCHGPRVGGDDGGNHGGGVYNLGGASEFKDNTEPEYCLWGKTGGGWSHDEYEIQDDIECSLREGDL